MWDGECVLRYADEEMRAAYGEDKKHECSSCANRISKEAFVTAQTNGGAYCALTNKRRKCSDYGFACGRFADAGRYQFVVR